VDWKEKEARWKRFAGVMARRRKSGGQFVTCSSSLERTPTQLGYPDPAWRWMRRVRLDSADAAEKRRPLETSRRGVFAIGDVRSSSVKRVAAAVGEGAQVVATLHAFLATADQGPAGERL